jgi:hypothetical protein
MRADPATGLPQDLGHGCDLQAVCAWPATRAGCRPGPPRTMAQPDGGFAMDACYGHDFIQELVFSARVACRYRSRWTAAYTRRLARVTGPSWAGLVTVTSELQPGLW